MIASLSNIVRNPMRILLIALSVFVLALSATLAISSTVKSQEPPSPTDMLLDVSGGTTGGNVPNQVPDGQGGYLQSDPVGAAGGVANAAAKAAKDLVCQLNLGLSWLTCGFTDNIMMINNALYKAISSMLVFPKKLVANGDTAHGLWNVFRMAANTILLAAFIVIIFSQATSIGLSAYGVKKLLPRVMAFAIIINLSFFISQLAIDVSNIAGAGINRTVASMAANASGGSHYPEECPEMASFNPTQADSDTKVWQCALNLTRKDQSKEMELMGMAMLPALMFPGPIIAIIIFVAVVAIIAIFIGFVVLLARQIIIVAMVIFSPIGIACAILPGTKKIYEFWKNTFASMLFMFPIISLLFAGSNLIALMIPQMQFFTGTSLQGVAAYINVLVVIIVLVSPWFAIPFVVKTSGGMLGKLTGALDKFSRDKMKGAAGAVGGAAKDRAKNLSNVARTMALNSKSSAVRRMAGAGFIARKQARAHNVKELERAKVGAAAKHIDGAKPGRYSPEQVGAAKETQDKLDLENAIRTFTYTMGGDVEKALKQAIENGDYHLANVALEKSASAGDDKTVSSAIDKLANGVKRDGSQAFSDEALNKFAASALEKGGSRISENNLGLSEKLKQMAAPDKSKDFSKPGTRSTQQLRTTGADDAAIVAAAVNKLSNSQLASHKQFGGMVKAGNVDMKRVQEIYNDDRTYNTITHDSKTIIESVAGGPRRRTGGP